MPDLSFAAFNPRSFEQMAQALASKVVGPGTMVFGDGPDGGREASFDGRVPYPNPEAAWDGHIVMQAKFRQREPAPDDAEWLAGQLRAEFAAYSEPTTGRRLPDYYILVTNVRLSSVEGAKRKGGQQKLRELFEEHGRPLGIREMHVWHAEKIAVLLDGAPEVLRSYDAWLGPREVLSAAFRFFQSQRPDFGTVMTRYLQRELCSQRETRLQQAGHGGEGGTNLEEVGVLRKGAFAFQEHPSRSVRDSARLVLALAADLDPGSLSTTLFEGSEDTLERYAALKLAQGGLPPEPVAGKVLVASVSALDRSAPGIRADALRSLGNRLNDR